MNWERTGPLAEVVGAAGVIVSLLYLATQVRAGNRAGGYTTLLSRLATK